MIRNYISINIAAYWFVSARTNLTTGYWVQTWAYKTPAQIAQFVASLNPQTDYCVLEATAKYHLQVVHALREATIPLSRWSIRCQPYAQRLLESIPGFGPVISIGWAFLGSARNCG